MSTTFLSDETTRYYEDMWIAYQLKALSKDRYCFLNDLTFGKSKKEWWSITSCDEWKNILFHFELKWGGGTSMTEASKLNIRVHLESKFINEETDRASREYFEEHGCIFGGKNAPNTIKEVNGAKLDASVIPDFSDEEKAKDTIHKIIEVLDLPAYQQCADIADAYLHQMKKGK